VRLFVALDIPESVRAALMECSAELSKICRSARWVRLEGAHVTLKFIGEVPEDRAEAIRTALAAIRGFGPLDLHFTSLGFFPNAKRPGVLWAGIEARPEFARLATAIEERVAEFGVEREDRELQPHITLARFNSAKGLDPLRGAIEKLGVPDFGRTTAREFHLYQSMLKRSGAEYTRLATYAFSGEPSS
jgi:2'-5' RNA ligase